MREVAVGSGKSDPAVAVVRGARESALRRLNRKGLNLVAVGCVGIGSRRPNGPVW